MMPFSRIDAASSASPRSSNVTRGCKGFGRIFSIATSRACPSLGAGVAGAVSSRAGAGAAAASGVAGFVWRWGSSAESPLPRARRLSAFICENLLRQLDVCLSAFRAHVIRDHRFTEAWRLGKADAAGYDRLKNVFAKELPQILRHLAHEDGALIIHGQEDALDSESCAK